MNAVAGHPGAANPDGNAFRLVERVLRSEKAQVSDVNSTAHRAWRVINPQVSNALGHPVGYAIVPGGNSVPYPLAGGADAPARPVHQAPHVVHAAPRG